MPDPEQLARLLIDDQLAQAGWVVQDRADLNLYAGRGVAVREFTLSTGEADYLLFADGKAVGVIEAKPKGTTLSGVADQSGQYLAGLPANIPHVSLPLPFAYESTGVETFFRSGRDPMPRSRRVFAFHRPETLAEWAAEPCSLRARLQGMPELIRTALWPAQAEAICNLEASLAADKPRALIQMATGSGKTFTAVNAVYRLIRYGGAKRVLFLVDRNNLGRQTLREFQSFVTPDDGRKFSELYNVQRLESNTFDPVSQVVITTIQRLYSMLAGEEGFDPENEEGSLFELNGVLTNQQSERTVNYNPRFPIEAFDFIITDECHRSIYNLWRQVLEYFDAYLIGLTATPSKQTFGFFNQNLVMEYSRRRAVADGVNVDGQVYHLRTKIGEEGAKIEAGYWVDRRDKLTRAVRWEELEDDLTYTPEQLDREVVAENQIRTVARAFKERLGTELFPGRSEVPKTLVFAKDDSHAEDIVRIFREEFGRGNDFCQKITYRVTGRKPEELINDFRNSFNPRIAVTVDMIATGTDVKPIECLLFLRLVRSRSYFEQMLGRGTRVISPTDLQAVTADAASKDRFILVDAVGVVEQEKIDTQTLERKRTVPFEKLLDALAVGVHDEDMLSSLAGRLGRLERSLTPAERAQIAELSGGYSLGDLAHAMLDALDADRIEQAAGEGGAAITAEGLEQAAERLREGAARLLASRPALRQALVRIHAAREQVIDTLTVDVVTVAEFDPAAAESLRAMVEDFRRYIGEHKDEITALQIIFGQPYGQAKLTFEQVKELAERLQQPPRAWTTEALWRAYAQLERDRVRGVGQRRVLADVVSLVRHAAALDNELVPYPQRVAARYADWLAGQEAAGQPFTAEQRWWLDRIAEHIGVNLSIRAEDFDYGEFFNRGGRMGAQRAFGKDLYAYLESLNHNLNP